MICVSWPDPAPSSAPTFRVPKSWPRSSLAYELYFDSSTLEKLFMLRARTRASMIICACVVDILNCDVHISEIRFAALVKNREEEINASDRF